MPWLKMPKKMKKKDITVGTGTFSQYGEPPITIKTNNTTYLASYSRGASCSGYNTSKSNTATAYSLTAKGKKYKYVFCKVQAYVDAGYGTAYTNFNGKRLMTQTGSNTGSVTVWCKLKTSTSPTIVTYFSNSSSYSGFRSLANGGVSEIRLSDNESISGITVTYDFTT